MQHLTTPVFGKGVVYDCPNDMLMQQKRMVKPSDPNTHIISFHSDHLSAPSLLLQVKVGLSTENLRAYIPMIRDETTHFLSSHLHLSSTSETPFDALESMAELIILTAARTLQGKEVRQTMDAAWAKHMEHLDGGFTPLNFMFPNLPLPSYRRRDIAQVYMSNFYQNIVKKRRSGETDVSIRSPGICPR